MFLHVCVYVCVCVCVYPLSLSPSIRNLIFWLIASLNLMELSIFEIFVVFLLVGKNCITKKLSRVLLNTSKNNFFHLKIWAFKKNQVLVARLKNHHYGHVILLTQVFGRQV